jgi:hypothetical protein
MEPLRLFTVFHLNLAFSSIEEDRRAEVIERCYWPLLGLTRELELPIGLEASGYTLDEIHRIDPAWIGELREAITSGRCEFVGSGYAQLIGPLAPAEVNSANLRLGHRVYEDLLGMRPRIALVGEQAYSAGLVPHYDAAGYDALVMEWENPASHHPDWNPEWRYTPQPVQGTRAVETKVIWSSLIAFQKFQRYVHGDQSLEDYMSYLDAHVGNSPRSLCLYGNDAEIFDFRPGRFETEAPIVPDGEWDRIRRLMERIPESGRFVFCAPGDVLDLEGGSVAPDPLRLETATQPIPVKKQPKYNVTRWAVTGRDDLTINTFCWKIYESLRDRDATDEDWRELCYLWSSDFRTHIAPRRWTDYRNRLGLALDPLAPSSLRDTIVPADRTADPKVRLHEEGRHLTVDTQRVTVRLDSARGLAIDALWLGDASGDPAIGTLPHGYYDDVRYAADFYSGHLVLEAPGQHKVTDLSPVIPKIEQLEDRVEVTGTVATTLGPIGKKVSIFYDESRLDLEFDLHWSEIPAGSLRLGYLTLNPRAFLREELVYRTHNGGREMEAFPFGEQPFLHGRPVSFLVSASQAVGMTEGILEIGDGRSTLEVQVDKSRAAAIGLISFEPVDGTYLCRLALSLRELDETSQERRSAAEPPSTPVRISLRAR